ncbi:MAG: hypothetical protein JWP49_1775 [Phenylobacterium sp.]|nr:hypothetical protein [Phenylobacterium sp.]
MDIHKPKPVHSWRELLTEIGVVVIGVLIALSAEQAVEWLHWREKAHHAEQSIRQDLALAADIASERVAVGRCLDERLLRLRTDVQASGPLWQATLPNDSGGLPFETPYRTPNRLWNAQTWDSLVADGTVSHLDPARARTFALLYFTIRGNADLNDQENRETSDLQVLADKGAQLTPETRIRLIQRIDGLRQENEMIALVSRQVLRRIQDTGYLPPLDDTRRRLASRFSDALKCRYADQALRDRVAQDWFTLHR